jgi:hypothetical protein
MQRHFGRLHGVGESFQGGRPILEWMDEIKNVAILRSGSSRPRLVALSFHEFDDPLSEIGMRWISARLC